MQILLAYEFPIAENLCKICPIQISYDLFVYHLVTFARLKLGIDGPA